MRTFQNWGKLPRANAPIRTNLTQREHDDSFTYTAPEQLPLPADDHHRGRVCDNAQKQETWGSGPANPIDLFVRSGRGRPLFPQDPNRMAKSDLSGVATHRALLYFVRGGFPVVPFL